MNTIELLHWGNIPYGVAWEKQEALLKYNIDVKKRNRERELMGQDIDKETTKNYFVLCEHPPVFTLGKSGHIEHLLVNNQYLKDRGISFYHTNRGGDITFHGLGQIVGYPILDLELYKTDLVWYMRNLEEVIMRTLAYYNIYAIRSAGETGVWIDIDMPHKARKICAMGVRTSRWVTMHGFALNVNTDLQFFDMIIPCGIQNKKVTSIQKELGREVDMKEVETLIVKNFAEVFEVEIMPM